MPENKKIKNITKEIIEKYDLKFDSSTSKTFKHSYMIEMLNMWSQVPVHPFGFATAPVDAVSSVSLVSSVCWPNVHMFEGKPLHIWTATGLAVTSTSLLISGNWFVMMLMDVDDVDWWKLVSGYWYWIQDTGYRMMITGLISLMLMTMSVAGSPSLVGW